MEKIKLRCGVCGEELVPCTQDHRKLLCTKCRLERCGLCGGIIMGHYASKTILIRVAEWAIPKKIFELFSDRSRNSCERCGRGYPYWYMIFRYVYWEFWVLSLEIRALD